VGRRGEVACGGGEEHFLIAGEKNYGGGEVKERGGRKK